MKLPSEQRRFLLRPLAIMTVSVFILLSLSCVFIVTSSNRLKLNSTLMKVTSTQRSLSQKIVNYIAADNLEGKITGLRLDSLISSFTQLQHVLLYGDQNLNVAPLKEDMISEYHKLDIGYINFFRELGRNISNDSASNFLNLLNTENLYLEQLDNFSARISGASNQEVENFQFKEISIICISIILIFIEVRFIFLPAIKKIEGQNTALREISFTQAHIVRRPLTNIQSLLTMILDNKKQDQFVTELLTLAKKEADELDAVIKNNVHKSDKHNKIEI